MFKPVWRSFLLLNRRQKFVFLLIVGLRVIVHALDLLGLAAIGVLGAMLAGGLTSQTDAQFLGISVPVADSRNYLWVSGVIAGFFPHQICDRNSLASCDHNVSRSSRGSVRS